MAANLVVEPIPGLVPVRDARGPLRVLIASLAPGGAERIVIEWLAAESARGREAELAVLHPRRTALAAPPGVRLRIRGRETPEDFLAALCAAWQSPRVPVSAHLVGDAHLSILWAAGVPTIPVVHNARPGWRNDPATWEPRHVPHVVACAQAVRDELLAHGCRVPVSVIRHRPRVGPAAVDAAARRAVREELGIGPETFLVAAVGAMKPQKDHARAVEVLAALARRRDAALVILGGVLDPGGLAELDRVLDAAARLGVADRLRLPGFVTAIEPWLAACDALLNVSRHEGLSIAVQEGLAAGLPVLAADVGGQREIVHPRLELVRPSADATAIASRLARLPVRRELVAAPLAREPRAWSLPMAARAPTGAALDTLFVTANLNAGGAQRSLVNLACALAGRHRFAIAVCGPSTHAAFATELGAAGVEVFAAAADSDDFAIAESLLAHAFERGLRTLCFWNVAPGVKLLASRFAPAGLRLVDVSPGRYAFEEMAGCGAFAQSLGHDVDAHYARLDALVLKHDDPAPPPARCIVRIPNGVAARAASGGMPPRPRFLVSGRIAPSKRLDVMIEAFRAVRVAAADAELHVFGVAEPRHADHAAALFAASGPGIAYRGPGFDLAHLAEPWTAAVVLGIHQGCPNAVLEAMSAGIPVIANASGGTAEVMGGGGTGWLLPEDAGAAEVAAAMRVVIAQPDEARARAALALARSRSHYAIASMVRRYLELLAPEPRLPREKMGAWSSATVPAALAPSSSDPSPTTAAP